MFICTDVISVHPVPQQDCGTDVIFVDSYRITITQVWLWQWPIFSTI